MAKVDATVLRARAARLRGLLAESPDDATLWAGLGRALLQLERPAEAVEPLRNAARLDPESVAAHRDLGRALLESGNPSEAARIFAHAVALAEKSGDVRTGRQIHVFLKRAEKAGGAS